MNEAFVLPLTQKEHKETLESNPDISRGSYKTYIHNTNTYKRNTKNGFIQEIHRYQAQNCKGCPLRTLCHKSKTNRVIERNYNLIRLKSKAKILLNSEQGIAKRKQRCWDVEAVFGNIKQNMNFKRFMLRGTRKVNVEIGLIAMAHNLKKYSLTI